MVVYNAARFLARNAKIRNKLKELGFDGIVYAKQGGVTSYKESQKGKQYVTESGATGRYPKAKDVTADQAADEMGISGRKNQKIDTALFTRKGLADAGMEEVKGKTGGSVKKLKKSKSKRSYRGYGAARKG